MADRGVRRAPYYAVGALLTWATTDENWSILLSRHGFDLGTRPLWQVIAHAYTLLVEPYEAAKVAALATAPLDGGAGYRAAVAERLAVDERFTTPPKTAQQIEDEWGMDPASEAANRWLDANAVDG